VGRVYPILGATFREILIGQPHLRDDHYSSGFKRGTEKAMNVDRVPVEPVSDVPVVLAQPLTLRAASGQRTGL